MFEKEEEIKLVRIRLQEVEMECRVKVEGIGKTRCLQCISTEGLQQHVLQP